MAPWEVEAIVLMVVVVAVADALHGSVGAMAIAMAAEEGSLAQFPFRAVPVDSSMNEASVASRRPLHHKQAATLHWSHTACSQCTGCHIPVGASNGSRAVLGSSTPCHLM